MTPPDVSSPGGNPANAETQTTNKHTDSAASEPVAESLSHYAAKRQSKLQAVAALQGVALNRLADGSWLASRWNLSKTLADTEVEAWLRQIGGQP